jgi:hypothetical protein
MHTTVLRFSLFFFADCMSVFLQRSYDTRFSASAYVFDAGVNLSAST